MSALNDLMQKPQGTVVLDQSNRAWQRRGSRWWNSGDGVSTDVLLRRGVEATYEPEEN